MKCAVVQKTLEPPSIDQLKRAFQGIPGLTQADAYVLRKDAFGILVRGFPDDHAFALKAALAAQGVETEVVEDARLPVLPQVRHVNRVDCAPHALLIYDPLGRTFPLEWKNIGLIAAGRVAVNEFNQVQTEHRVPYPGHAGRTEIVVENEFKEERHDRLLLEIVVRGNVLRYCVNADRSSHLLFQYLGERRTKDLLQNFTLLVQDLCKGAPSAAVNRGAYYFRENSAEPFYYPSKNAFCEEMTWLLWQMSLPQKPE